MVSTKIFHIDKTICSTDSSRDLPDSSLPEGTIVNHTRLHAFRVMESANPESQLNPCRWYHRCAVWPTKNLYPTYWKTVPPNAGIEAGKFLKAVGVLDDATYWDRSSSNVKNLTKSCVKSHLKSVVTRVHE